jgi:serine/threonine protein phosphatase PrpC
MEICFAGLGVTHPGAAALKNEDSVLIVESHPLSFQKGNLYAVADGIGSEPEGLVASDQTLRLVEDGFYKSEQSGILESLSESIKKANLKIFTRSRKLLSTSGMGSTISAVAILGNHAFVAHVGDSRVFHYSSRSRDLEPLTQDDVDEQGRLVRSIGGGYYVEVQTQEVELAPHDLLLLCTDGLTDALSDKEISSVLESTLSINAKCMALLGKALTNRRALDNLSIIIIGEEKSRRADVKIERVGGLVPIKENNVVRYKEEVQKVTTLPGKTHKSFSLRMMVFVLTIALIFSAIGIVCGVLIGGKFIPKIKETSRALPFPVKISAFDYYSNAPINDFSAWILGRSQRGTLTFFPRKSLDKNFLWVVRASGYVDTSISVKPTDEKDLNVFLKPQHFVFIDVIVEEGEKTKVKAEVGEKGSKGALSHLTKDKYHGYYYTNARPGYCTIEAKGENSLFYEDKKNILIDSTLLNDKHVLACTLGLANWDTLLMRWEKEEIDSASVKDVTPQLYELQSISNQISGLLEDDCAEGNIKKAMELFDKLEVKEILPKSKTLSEQNRESYLRIKERLESKKCSAGLKEEIKDFCDKYSSYFIENQ